MMKSQHASGGGQTPSRFTTPNANEQLEFYGYGNEFDESGEESQRKINQFSHELVELLKVAPRCIIPLSKFNNEYYKKYGRQCRVAEYGYTKLVELLESIPHILQMLDSEFEKKLTLTHRVQVRRFSNDLIKVLKAHSTKQMFADEYPSAYEKHFSKPFDIRDYGVCYLEDMLAELPESIICRKEIEGRTFIQIPKIVQINEERLCTHRLTFDIIDMLKHKPRFSIQFNKFIPNFHHHFGRQCKLSNYGFTKLIELMDAMPDTVQVIIKDGLQFVQLKKEVMLDLIAQNLVKLIEESPGIQLSISLAKLEEIYNSKYEHIFYKDFDCDNFSQFYSMLPFERYGIRTLMASSLPNEIEFLHYFVNLNQGTGLERRSSINFVNVNEHLEWIVQVDRLNEKDLKKLAKLMLKKLMENSLDELLMEKIVDRKNQSNRALYFKDLLDFMFVNCADLTNYAKSLNKRGFYYVSKLLSDFFVVETNDKDYEINGLSEIYVFAKQIRTLYKSSNLLDMTFNELEMAYKQVYKANNSNSGSQERQLDKEQVSASSAFPYKKLGFVDPNLLFTQGLHLVVTVKKYDDIAVCLNKEFWPVSFLDAKQGSMSSDVSPASPGIFQNANYQANLSNGNNAITPVFQRLPASTLPSAFSRRSLLKD